MKSEDFSQLRLLLGTYVTASLLLAGLSEANFRVEKRSNGCFLAHSHCRYLIYFHFITHTGSGQLTSF